MISSIGLKLKNLQFLTTDIPGSQTFGFSATNDKQFFNETQIIEGTNRFGYPASNKKR